MMKHEFEKLAGISIPLSQSEYDVIETVYMYYPGIHHVKGKEQVAELYKVFGMRIFEDMLKRAETIANIQNKIIDYKKKIAELENDQQEL